MAKQQALSNNKVNLQALPPHIREFVTVSARYLDVRIDSSQQGTFARLEKGKIGVKQNDQEVGYAADYI